MAEDPDAALQSMDEETFLPMFFGLYFPMRAEGSNVIAYDAPEAEPYLETLLSTGWQGQTWLNPPDDTWVVSKMPQEYMEMSQEERLAMCVQVSMSFLLGDFTSGGEGSEAGA